MPNQYIGNPQKIYDMFNISKTRRVLPKGSIVEIYPNDLDKPVRHFNPISQIIIVSTPKDNDELSIDVFCRLDPVIKFDYNNISLKTNANEAFKFIYRKITEFYNKHGRYDIRYVTLAIGENIDKYPTDCYDSYNNDFFIVYSLKTEMRKNKDDALFRLMSVVGSFNKNISIKYQKEYSMHAIKLIANRAYDSYKEPILDISDICKITALKIAEYLTLKHSVLLLEEAYDDEFLEDVLGEIYDIEEEE